MKKELLIFYCETTGEGLQHCDIKQNPNKEDIEYSEHCFKTWSNCYLVKIRTTDKDGMFSDEVLYKRNIIL